MTSCNTHDRAMTLAIHHAITRHQCNNHPTDTTSLPQAFTSLNRRDLTQHNAQTVSNSHKHPTPHTNVSTTSTELGRDTGGHWDTVPRRPAESVSHTAHTAACRTMVPLSSRCLESHRRMTGRDTGGPWDTVPRRPADSVSHTAFHSARVKMTPAWCSTSKTGRPPCLQQKCPTSSLCSGRSKGGPERRLKRPGVPDPELHTYAVLRGRRCHLRGAT